MTYSGRCHLSQYFSARDGNRGACSHSCRWKYALVEEKRPGEYLPVYEDDTGSYIYNAKDLCTLPFLDQILDAGVTGLKIEGRMKTHFYVANVTSLYHQALELWKEGRFALDPSWMARLEAMTHRGYSSGFFTGKLGATQNLKGEREGSQRFAAFVQEKVGNTYKVAIKDSYRSGDPLWKIGERDFEPVRLTWQGATTPAGPGTFLEVHASIPLEPYDVLVQDHAAPPQETDLIDHESFSEETEES
jgi:putative protease